MLGLASIGEALQGFGDRYTKDMVQQFLELVPVESNQFPAQYCSDMLTGKLKDD